MFSDLNYSTLLEQGLIPSDVKEIEDVRKEQLVTYSGGEEVNFPSQGGFLVTDNYQWIVESKNAGIVYSSDGKFVYGYSDVSPNEGEYIKYLLKGKLIPINKLKIKINRRNDEMSDLQNKLNAMKENNQMSGAAAEKIAALKSQQGMQNSNAFAGNVTENDLKKAEQQTKMKNLENAIANVSDSVQLQDTADLYAYNYPRTHLIGWLVDRDRRLHAKATDKPVIDPMTKKVKLKENAPQDVKDIVAAGGRPPKEFTQRNTVLQVTEMMPGAAKFGIIEMPIDGFIPMDKLRDPNFKIEIDPKKNSDKVIKFLNKKELIANTIALLGGAIKESPKTHAEPTVINAFLKAKVSTNKETGRVENKLIPSLVTASKRKLITETNYFPKVVFAKMRLDEVKTEEDRKVANLSLFGHLFRSVAGKPSPYSRLDVTEKAKVSMNDGVIVSKFLDPKDSIPLDVVNVFTGNVIANPEIPVKEERESKDKKTTRLVNVSYDVTKDAPIPAGVVDPFQDPRFAAILEACGGKLNKEVITELYAKSRKKNNQAKASGVILSAEEATKVYLSAAQGGNEGLKNINFADALSHDEMKAFSQKALADFNNYYAAK